MLQNKQHKTELNEQVVKWVTWPFDGTQTYFVCGVIHLHFIRNCFATYFYFAKLMRNNKYQYVMVSQQNIYNYSEFCYKSQLILPTYKFVTLLQIASQEVKKRNLFRNQSPTPNQAMKKTQGQITCDTGNARIRQAGRQAE